MRYGKVSALLALIGLGCGVLVGCDGKKSPDPPAPASGVRPSGPSGSGSAVPSSAVASSRPTTSRPPSSPPRTGPLTTGPNMRPGEKPPVLSAEGKKHTVTGALDFATYYIQALDWSIATNDPYLLKQISLPSCTTCTRFISGIDQLRAKGQFQSGGRIVIHSSLVVTGKFTVKSERVVEFDIATGTAKLLYLTDRSPARAGSLPASRDKSLVFISWMGSAWEIVEETAP